MGPSGNNTGGRMVDDEILSRSSPKADNHPSHTCDLVIFPNIIAARYVSFSSVAVESSCTGSRIGWVVCLSPTTTRDRLTAPRSGPISQEGQTIAAYAHAHL